MFDAIRGAFRAAVEDVQGHVNVLGRARALLKAKLRSPAIAQLQPGGTIDPEMSHGYWTMEDGVRIYTIHAKAFRRWFANRTQAITLLWWLSERGNLIVDRGKLRPSMKSTKWASRACRWPGYKAVESFKLRDPF